MAALLMRTASPCAEPTLVPHRPCSSCGICHRCLSEGRPDTETIERPTNQGRRLFCAPCNPPPLVLATPPKPWVVQRLPKSGPCPTCGGARYFTSVQMTRMSEAKSGKRGRETVTFRVCADCYDPRGKHVQEGDDG